MEHKLGHGDCPACQRDNTIRIREIADLRTENARLQERVEDGRTHRLQHVELQLRAERERDALQERVEEAEITVGDLRRARAACEEGA